MEKGVRGVSSISVRACLDFLAQRLLTRSTHTDRKMSGNGHLSKDIIPKSLDKAMDKANPDAKNGAPGISIRNGPMDKMEIDGPEVNGASTKRKGRGSMGKGKTYKEASDEDDEEGQPLVRDMRR